MASKNNPRFPHKLEILRAEYDQYGESIKDEDGNEILKVVFESECGLREMVRGTDTEIKVLQADYKLALPRTKFVVQFRDTIRFIHSYTGEVIKGRVEAYKTFNLGTNIWFQSGGNG